MASAESTFKFVEELNALERVPILTVSDAVLTFLMTPSSANFQEQLGGIATEQK
jgi:hypothetical protein